MAYLWDPAKALANVRKHGIGFADAVGALEDPLSLTLDDPHPTEDRFLNLGQDYLGRIVVVSWTFRGSDVRIISARLATPRERQSYEEDPENA